MSPLAWALHAGEGLTTFTQSGGQRVRDHVCPAWMLCAGLRDDVELSWGSRRVCSPAVLVPAGVVTGSQVAGPFVALFVDAWRVSPVPVTRPVSFGHRQAGQIIEQLSYSHDRAAEAVAQEFLGPTEEDVVSRALSNITPRTTAVQFAQALGVSPSQARRILAARGVTFTQVRRWRALREALTTLRTRDSLATVATEAGFSDQSHLTRTASRVLGRTPGSFT